MLRTYSELITLSTFIDRYRYLKLGARVGEETFGWERYLNQGFYKSEEWKRIRNEVIIRDNGCDLGVDGYEINSKIYIHHINPIGAEDIANVSELLCDPEFLISTSFNTHQAIHYGDESLLVMEPIIRKPNDTKLW